MNKKLLMIIVIFYITICVKAGNLALKGIITDTQNNSLPNAIVQIKPVNNITLSNNDGHYTFQVLTPGTYNISVSYLGFIEQSKKITLTDKTKTLSFKLQEQTNPLDQIVITGTGTIHKLRDVPVTTEIIGKNFLSMYSGQSLQDILAGISPSFDFNQNIMGSNIQMNGLKNDYILILLNGERLHGDIGGQNLLGMININNIQKIEIVKGASSSLYGSDAVAGVINIITKKPKSKISVDNTSRIASYGSLEQSNMFSIAKGKLRSTTSFNYKQTDGWKNTDKELYNNNIYENSVTKTVNKFSDYKISEKINYIPIDKLELEISADLYKKKIERPCGYPKYDTYGMMYNSFGYYAKGTYNFNKENYIKISASYNQTKYLHNYTVLSEESYVLQDGTLIHPIYNPGDVIRVNTQQRLISEIKDVTKIGTKQTISGGINFRKDWLNSPYRLTKENKSDYSTSIFLQDEYTPFKSLNVTFGGRIIFQEQFGNHFTPKISLLKKINKFNLRATWSQGFKTPTIKELHYHYKRSMMSKLTLYLGNEELKPQTSDYYAITGEYKTNKLSLSLTTYKNELDNMITLIEIPTAYENKMLDIDRTMEYQNIEDAITQGFDFLFKYKISQNISFGGGYSFLDASGHMLNEDYEIEENKLDGTAKHHANIYSLWNHQWKMYKLGIGLFGKSQSKRYYRSYGNTKAYTLWKINTNHKLRTSKNYSLEVNTGIDNILDYKETIPYGNNYGTKTPGRTYYLSLNINLKK